MTTQTPAFLNDLDRIEAGEVKDLRELSTDFLEVILLMKISITSFAVK